MKFPDIGRSRVLREDVQGNGKGRDRKKEKRKRKTEGVVISPSIRRPLPCLYIRFSKIRKSPHILPYYIEAPRQ